MQQTDETVKELQQQASAHYLGGRFAEALAAWKRILEIDPNDERALEGVQLCSLLTEQTATDTVEIETKASTEADPPQAAEPEETVDPSQPESIEPIEFEVPEFEIDLPPAEETSSEKRESEETTSEVPDPHRQDDGIDFGDEPETLALAADRPEPEEASADVEAGAFEFDLGNSGETEEGETPAAGDTVASAEHEERVRGLLADARAAIDRDDREFAREALARLFALDETNEQALQLQELLESRVPSGDGPAIEDPEHAAAPGAFDLDLDDPDAVEGVPLQDAVPTAGEPEGEVAEDFDLPDPPPGDAALGEEPATDEEAVPAAVGFDTAPPRRGVSVGSPVVRLALVALVVAGGFFGVRSLFGGGESAPDGDGAVAAVGAGRVPAPPAEPSPQPAAAEPQPAVTEPESEPQPAEPQVVMPTESVDTLMLRADAAARAGDYAAAIVSFNDVLLLEPGNEVARQRMEEASEAYRNQQALADKWQTAFSTFRNGSYRDALRQFYRLPGGAEGTDPKLERYKVNAWYNLGLEALRTSRCSEAQGHFDEVAAIEPAEFGLASARALVQQCFANPGDPQYRKTVAAIGLRGLED